MEVRGRPVYDRPSSSEVLDQLAKLDRTAMAAPTEVPPTPVPPTATPVPPTATPVPPTATPVPPTATPVPQLLHLYLRLPRLCRRLPPRYLRLPLRYLRLLLRYLRPPLRYLRLPRLCHRPPRPFRRPPRRPASQRTWVPWSATLPPAHARRRHGLRQVAGVLQGRQERGGSSSIGPSGEPSAAGSSASWQKSTT